MPTKKIQVMYNHKNNTRSNIFAWSTSSHFDGSCFWYYIILFSSAKNLLLRKSCFLWKHSISFLLIINSCKKKPILSCKNLGLDRLRLRQARGKITFCRYHTIRLKHVHGNIITKQHLCKIGLYKNWWRVKPR